MSPVGDKKPVRFRESRPADWRSIEAIYSHAFTDEDLVQLVQRLLRDPASALSLVAVTGTAILANIIFTHCTLDRSGVAAALLAPLAVVPDHQEQGLGTGLIRAGLERLREHGTEVVYVLGDPAYYGRFGFAPERSVATPYRLPLEWADAWQSLRLGEATVVPTGTLQVPDVWLDPALWSP